MKTNLFKLKTKNKELYYDSPESTSSSEVVNETTSHLLNKYYAESNTDEGSDSGVERISSESNEQSKVLSMVQQLESYPPHQNKQQDKKLGCAYCSDKNKNDNFVVLSCNHVFHVSCLAEKQFYEQSCVIDSDYFDSRKCDVCFAQIQPEELMFIHSKFLNSTKSKMTIHQRAIESLEEKLKHVKDELRVCYDYKQKLEHEREKSKQIVATLMTMM